MVMNFDLAMILKICYYWGLRWVMNFDLARMLQVCCCLG
jgi:hypothetical protein